MTSIPSRARCSTSAAFTPAVAGDEQRHARRRQPLEAGHATARTLGQPGRDVPHRLRPRARAARAPRPHRGHAIGVVVAPDGDPLASVDGRRCEPARHRHRPSGHVVQDARRPPGSAELRVVAEAATRQQGGHRPAEAGEGRRVRETAPAGAIRGGDGSPGHGSRAAITAAYRAVIRLVSSAAERLDLPARPRPALRFASHSYQATSSWLALKIDE